jgi:transposase-like protein
MKKETVQKRQDADKKLLVEQLKKTPIIQLACERCGISRTTYYQWRKDDEQFRKDSDDSMKDGKDMINDLSESQLIALIKEKNFNAIQLWLRQHHHEYGNRLEIKAKIEAEDPLTPEQEALVKKALGN